MASNKDRIKFKKASRGKNRVARPQREKPSSGGSLRWLWRLTLTMAIVVVLFWQQEAITSWLDDIGQGTVGFFGWGLALIILVVLAIFAFIWRQQLAELSRRWRLHLWNLWLGTAAFIFVVWGILAFLDLGGQFGQDIIGEDQAGGILRLVGLAVLGIILVAPRPIWRLVKGLFSWIGQPAKAPPPRPIREEYRPAQRPGMTRPPQKAPLSKGMEPPAVLVPPEITRPDVKPEPAVAKTQEAKPEQDLKQVAQEVWQKYGQSPSLTVVDGWSLPPIDILDHAQEVEFSDADNIKRSQLIEEALASYGVEARIVQINAGPTVTQFGIEPGWDRRIKEIKEKDKDGRTSISKKEVSRTRVKVERITSLANDLALALASPSIRIEAPVPGKSIVGIEVPNATSGVVSLRGVIETNAFQKILVRSSLALGLGKGAGGEAIAGDLDKMPHLLIAGATGSGKTVCLNAIICCLLLDNTPSDIKLIMIDPKRVELTPYNSLPHLASPVIVDVQKALPALRWLNQEMDRRYQTLATVGSRNIAAFNKGKHGDDKMPYTVLIIDELADLMMAGFDEVEHILCRLAQLARAVGIHLIVATQRPSVDVVTGLIKANFPTRISFAVTSQVDSRTILDIGGAEKLLGRGDMLYAPTEAAKPKRLQGCYVSDAEVERLVYFWNNQKREEALAPRIDELKPQPEAGTKDGYPDDSLLEAARQLAREHDNISTSFLQRRLHIGYPRAARIMDQLNEEKDEGEE